MKQMVRNATGRSIRNGVRDQAVRNRTQEQIQRKGGFLFYPPKAAKSNLQLNSRCGPLKEVNLI